MGAAVSTYVVYIEENTVPRIQQLLGLSVGTYDSRSVKTVIMLRGIVVGRGIVHRVWTAEPEVSMPRI